MQQVEAATLINPTSPPPGGQTAEPITSSSTEQRKLGSLIIGPSGSSGADNPLLCLNASDLLDDTKCISNWSEVNGIFGSSYVKLNIGALFFPPTGQQLQSGYVRLQGDDLENYPVTSRFAVYDGLSGTPVGTYTALYADGLSPDNMAGYFVGTFGVEPSVNGSLGRLCLNGTAASAADSSAGHYCISQWSQVVPNITNKFTLQSLTPTSSPVSEIGGVSLGQAFNSGAMIIGDPSTMEFKITCGDGMCNAGETATAGPKYCPIDCVSIGSIAIFTATSNVNGVDLEITTGTQSPAGTPRTILVVRSDAALNSFRPMHGIKYARGGTTNFAVVDTKTCTPFLGRPSCTVYITDPASMTDPAYTGLISGRTYYYSAWQGNAYPRYQLSPTSALPVSMAVTGSGSEESANQPPPVQY